MTNANDKLTLEVTRMEFDFIMLALAVYAAQASVRACKATDKNAKAGALLNGRKAGALHDKLLPLATL